MKIEKRYTDAEVEWNFARFENMAKDPVVTDFMLRDDLYTFLKRAGYNRTIYKLSPPVVFRARTATVATLDDALAKYDRAAKLTYPNGPAVDFIGKGRCNKAKEAVFYCSNENGVPIFEVHPKEGDYVVLSQFRNKGKGSVTFQGPMIGVKEIRQNLVNRGIANNWQQMLESDWQNFSKEPHHVKIDDMITQWFLKSVDASNGYYYRLTTMIYKILTENIMHDGVFMDGLIYPSVASNTTGVNFALKTDLVDDNFDFFGAILYHFEQINADGHMELRMKKQAWAHEITDEDKLNWRDIDLAGASDLLVLGTDLTPGEFPEFDPQEFVEMIKAHSNTH